MSLHIIDWIIIAVYLMGMIGLSVYLSRGQSNEEDYYLGGNDTGFFPIAISTMATQCSTNSILGAPAFVAFTLGGGLVWLQYEISLPLAMIVVMAFMLPFFRSLKIISVYNYLELRFGPETRMVLSVLFQFLRAFATGVTVYGISLVISYCTGVSFFWSVVGLGIITIIYDSIGGMKAVIYSDVIQMGVLFVSILLIIYMAISLLGGPADIMNFVSADRVNAIDFSHTGLGDGQNFSFWPMLFGGFFLYASYYGCDQTQVQRELSTKSIDDTNKSLFVNGILRFPLVLTYCFLGICIAAYVAKFPEFIDLLPKTDKGTPNYNMSVPIFVLKEFPVGIIGIFMVGLFSAAMSSLDSTINSLSATTIEDIIKKFTTIDKKKELLYSKLLTVFWGILCVVFAFYVENIAESIIEAINKIGSLINGPILGVFLLGLLTKRCNQLGALLGFGCGFILNAILWVKAPEISWLWWNAIGFVVTFGVGFLVSFKNTDYPSEQLVWSRGALTKLGSKVDWKKYYLLLAAYSVLITLILLWIS